jgi:diguanylate cyclase (GGDEF)-like protein
MTFRRTTEQPQGDGAQSDIEDSAEHLLQRQATLEQALMESGSGLAGLLSRTPPAPAALVMIESVGTRERYLKVLNTAGIETDVAADRGDAFRRLAERVHALLFTDDAELITQARHLTAGSATHMVLINDENDAGDSEGLRAGANEIMPKEPGGERFWAQITMARRLVSFAASLQSAVTDNRLLSSVDGLTRVGNRSYFEHQWPREVKRALRYNRPLSLIVCDVDHFKSINDEHGHLSGDAVLTELGERLTGGLRLGEDWVARVGGEEFAIILPETGRFEACAIAERLRERISVDTFLGSSLALAVTASFGICALPSPAQTIEELPQKMFQAADRALYESKRSGRNCVTEGMVGTAAPGA